MQKKFLRIEQIKGNVRVLQFKKLFNDTIKLVKVYTMYVASKLQTEQVYASKYYRFLKLLISANIKVAYNIFSVNLMKYTRSFCFIVICVGWSLLVPYTLPIAQVSQVVPFTLPITQVSQVVPTHYQ